MRVPGNFKIDGSIKAVNLVATGDVVLQGGIIGFYLGDAEDVVTGGAEEGEGLVFTKATGLWGPGVVGGTVTFKDGINEHSSSELNFNSDDFYLSTDLGGAPVVNKYHPWRGALTNLTSDQSIPDDGTFKKISWDTVVTDTNGFWNAGDPTKITIPSGVSRVRLTFQAQWQGRNSGDRHARIMMNDGTYFGWAVTVVPHLIDNNISLFMHTHTGILSVITGDFFTGEVKQDSTFSVPIQFGKGTWFEIEVIE